MNIDELFDKAKNAVNIAAKKTNDVVELSKLKLDSVKLNNEINSMYEKLGRSVYNMRHDDLVNENVMRNLCEEIDELLEKLAGITDQIAEKKNVTVCEVCGTENVRDNCYCCKCGTKLHVECEEYNFDPREEAQKEECCCETEQSEEKAADFHPDEKISVEENKVEEEDKTE